MRALRTLSSTKMVVGAGAGPAAGPSGPRAGNELRHDLRQRGRRIRNRCFRARRSPPSTRPAIRPHHRDQRDGDVPLPRPAAGHVHHPRGAERLQHPRAQEQRAEPLGQRDARHHRAEGRPDHRDDRGRGGRRARSRSRTPTSTACSPANQLAHLQTKGRDVTSLLKLLPGVAFSEEPEALGDSFGSPLPSMGGQAAEANNYTVDGLNGNELSGTDQVAAAVSLDAIGEVKVLQNTYKAEYGRTGGANIQVSTKSGGTDYHGSAYWYGRRTNWNANSWENNRVEAERPRYHFNTYGFTLGGPFPGQGSDKKAFFFYNAEVPRVENPGRPALLQRAHRARAQRRLLPERRGHPRPAHRPALPRQHHPSQPHQPQRAEPLPPLPAAQHRSPRQRCRGQLRAPGDAGEPAHGPPAAPGLEAERQRHPLPHRAHLQLEPVRRGDHRRPRRTGASSTPPTSSRTTPPT